MGSWFEVGPHNCLGPGEEKKSSEPQASRRLAKYRNAGESVFTRAFSMTISSFPPRRSIFKRPVKGMASGLPPSGKALKAEM